jgi:hypothetical protein
MAVKRTQRGDRRPPKGKNHTKGGWRYQVVHRNVAGEDWFAIHEAFLNEHGEIRAITKDPMPADADSIAGVKQQLQRMLEDLEEFGVRWMP